LKKLDSGFRRNDKKWCFSTFYMGINFSSLVTFPVIFEAQVFCTLHGLRYRHRAIPQHIHIAAQFVIIPPINNRLGDRNFQYVLITLI